MTLQEAADYLDLPKKRLWRAVKAGQLEALQIQKGNRWEYRVTAEALDLYQQTSGLDDSESPAQDRSGTTWNDLERPLWNGVERDEPTWNDTERVPTDMERPGTLRQVATTNFGQPSSPPAEVYIALIDRLSRAERRSIELEIQLKQSQRLLSENAESITEKEAMARVAEAKLQAIEDAKQAESARLAAEMETIRLREAHASELETRLRSAEEARASETARLTTELESTRRLLAEAQRPKGLFSWLGLRKKRSGPSAAINDQAV